MASTFLFANNAQSTLAGAITSAATTAALAPGTGTRFPNPGVGEYFAMTFTDSATGLLNEIVYVTGRATDTITIQRAQEGTTAQNWSAGDIAANLWTAGSAAAMVQQGQQQSQDSNYALDSGSANHYVVALDPPLTAYVIGMPIRVKIQNGNTGASDLDAGDGPAPIINPDGSALGSATMASGGIYTFEWDGASFQLTSSNNGLPSAAGLATTGDVKWRPTEESLSGWVKANATTIGNAASGANGRANADTQALFSWLWTNFSNTQAPVSGGRGASAAADFAANKTIGTLAMQGLAIAGMDTMGGGATSLLTGVPVVSGSATIAGSVLGENLHALIEAENGPHTHSLTDPGHTHDIKWSVGPQYSGGGSGPPITTINPAGGLGPAESLGNTTGITIGSSGSGTPHNTVQRSMVGTFYLKL